MKKTLFLALITAITCLACSKEAKDKPYNPNGSLITMEQALEICKTDIDNYESVAISSSIVEKGKTFTNGLDMTHKAYKVPYDSWIVIINTDPLANSGQSWLYIYVDAYTGKTNSTSWQWGLPCEIPVKLVKNNSQPDSETDNTLLSWTIQENPQRQLSSAESNNWAVIISGGYNPSSNWERYWNDCSAMYKCLREVYNYRRDRIIVLMSDGTSSGLDRCLNDYTYASSPQDLDGDGIDDINYAATKPNITTVFNHLQNNVSANEQVFIFVTDHGARENNESYICLWNNTLISASEFANEVKKINTNVRKHIILGQCYSGGFVSPLVSSCSNITVTATDITDYDTGAPFVEFTPYTGQLPDEYYVSVDFTNPLGEGTSIVRRFIGEK